MKKIKFISLLSAILCVFILTSCNNERIPVTSEDFVSALDTNKFLINNVELDEELTSIGITKYIRAATEMEECKLQFIVFETSEQAQSLYNSNFKDDIYTTGKDYVSVEHDISESDFDYIQATVESGFLVTSRIGNTILAISSDSKYTEYMLNIIEELGYDK